MRVQKENFASNGSFKYNFQRHKYAYWMHIHQFAEIGYVISGELTVIVNRKEYTAKAGDFVFIFPMQVHAYRTPVTTDYMVSAFSGALVGDFLAATEGKCGASPVFRCSESVRQYFHATFVDGEVDDGDGIDKELGENQFAIETHIVDYTAPDKLCRIKSCLYAALSEYSRTVELVPDEGETDAFAKVMLHLADHYREPVTLASTAAAIGYSANYLSHCIKKTSGMNFATILGSLRIEHAQYLMRTRSDTILNIALECGFGTERSFHRMFKRVAGCTPGEFMRTK